MESVKNCDSYINTMSHCHKPIDLSDFSELHQPGLLILLGNSI
jgi:hypothetical protein